MAFGKSLELAAIQPGTGKWLVVGQYIDRGSGKVYVPGPPYLDAGKTARKANRAARLAKNKRRAHLKKLARSKSNNRASRRARVELAR